jgi:large subunit ribosomal protein L25
MANLTLQAQSRSEFGKGAARRIRRAHQIPAVMYGHGTDPVHITLPGHDTMLALKQPNALLTIVLDGVDQLALAKDVQRDPIKPVIEHIDLVVVRTGEKVTVDVAIHLTGAAGPDTFVVTEHQFLQVEVAATAIPEQVEVSIEGLPAGSQIHAEDIALPAGSVLLTDPKSLIVNITAQAAAAAETAAPAQPEASTES